MKARLTYPRRGLHGEVVHTIGVQIVGGELQPGDPLPPEAELITDLAVSRTVLREAVRVLSAKGLVEARPKTGTRVRAREDWNILDPDVLSWRIEATNDNGRLYDEATEMRLGIEPLAARLAATRALDEEIAGIAEAFAGMEAGVDDQAAYLAADLQFHDRILAASHNELLGHLGGILHGVLATTFELTTSPRRSRGRALPLHRAIVDGIAARDEARADQATRALIADSAADIKRLTRKNNAR